jgi:hypothetical protein
MSDYEHYTGREPIFGLGYPGAPTGELGSPHDEGVKTTAIGRIMGAMLGVLGVGIFAGGVGSVVDGALEISALAAVLQDDLGAVPVGAPETTLGVAEFAEGTGNFVHVQAGATARTDGGCGFYVDPSATPAPDALLVCQVTVTDGAVTGVDNSVRVEPALEARLTWAGLTRVFGGTQTLLQFMTASMGAAYLGATPPADVDSRLTTLESAIGEGGGDAGGPIYAALLAMSATDLRLVPQYIAAMIAPLQEQIAALEAGGAGSGGEAPVAISEDDGYNQGMISLKLAHYLPDVLEDQRNVATVARDHTGHGDGADGKDFVGEDSEW